MSEILERYKVLVSFLEKMLGPNYEIVLHDLKHNNGEIIAIENGYITGRKLGDPLSTFALQTIADKKYETSDYVLNYNAKSKSGRLLRSSTLYIKDDNKELIALLCLNFDDSKFLDLSEQLSKLVHPDETLFKRAQIDNKSEMIENFGESVSDVTQIVLEEYFRNNNINLDNLSASQKQTQIESLSQDARLAIVSKLNDRGVFLLKGAVNEVASILLCSEPTIYRYLNRLK
ncbi:PAS domain-containing protein [Erysipelotrichaceae bacterium OttesenSCG-928-M19]|nr:PAS domain-containing protein [Erysipelotrichaceae bacterium OttesenSCG-928-M19]